MCTSDQNNLRERVLKYALNEFQHHGIKNVRVDDIAAGLQMSKRTLYEMFDDKEHLLIESIRLKHEENRRRIDEVKQTAENPLEIFAAVFNMKLQDMHNISPLFISDLKRYESIQRGMEEEKRNRRTETLQFIDRCVEQGLFRSDINYDILVRIMDMAGGKMMESEFYKEYPLDEIIFTIYNTFFRSLCTPKGLEILDKTIKKHSKQ